MSTVMPWRPRPAPRVLSRDAYADLSTADLLDEFDRRRQTDPLTRELARRLRLREMEAAT